MTEWYDDIGCIEFRVNPRDIEIADCLFSVRLHNALVCCEGLTTLGEVLQYSQLDILRIPNCGRKSLNELLDTLKEHKLELSKTNKWRNQSDFNNEHYRTLWKG